ncbi:unnamed protein product [Aphanomyces euteiches]|uniref:BZIP domain-containing protein n=1 Tax=Aphanomyces euteiches TaxID=100861 RepID=A0A6G0W3S2_9STRA|nr:hypothetical protein Ae201684_018966 [Aphanomyces euteiches]KAH9076455.1 hypothetical protein Ae201684P_010399 [Aphanomyces euteiches]KAH9149639.1 hypothetical protein AeRB84_007358 [Aphanomyces euteiches]
MSTKALREEKKRQAARLRMQKHRDGLRNETKQLREEVRVLEARLELLKATPNGRKRPASVSKCANQVLMDRLAQLRSKTTKWNTLAHRLYAWVELQQPKEGLRHKMPWMESALLVDLESRRYGYQWLSEKAFHTAQNAFPPDVFGNSVEDMINVTAHLGEDDHGISWEAVEGHSQYTVATNYVNVAQALWDTLLQSSPMHTSRVVEEVDQHRLLYVCHELNIGDLKQLYIAARFEDNGRIIITQTTIATDDRFPIRNGECRSHGFGWTIVEPITATTTRLRRSFLHTPPTSSHGVLTLDEMARLNHIDNYQALTRGAIIAQLQAMIEESFVAQRAHIRRLCGVIQS